MNDFRIALANLRFPCDASESVALAEQAIAQASRPARRHHLLSGMFVPGYREWEAGRRLPMPAFLERAWSPIAAAAAKAISR